MPEHFTAAFAKRLDGLCKISVKEAENNDTIRGTPAHITLEQDEATSIVFGMPNEAITLGGVVRVTPLEALSREVIKMQF